MGFGLGSKKERFNQLSLVEPLYTLCGGANRTVNRAGHTKVVKILLSAKFQLRSDTTLIIGFLSIFTLITDCPL
jgi:hypothetical protein